MCFIPVPAAGTPRLPGGVKMCDWVMWPAGSPVCEELTFSTPARFWVGTLTLAEWEFGSFCFSLPLTPAVALFPSRCACTASMALV